ncbi:MAG TPA: hypothetical protein VG456_05145 [Candidatus Sulfopaludibacter sp.]|jgi:hypothetical protein|nr:hypothetical protein [Candidatus Sulfopaludibacter sp.]
MFNSLRRFLGLGLLGVMLVTAIPVFAAAQGPVGRSGKKSKKKKGSKRGGSKKSPTKGGRGGN